MHTVIKQHKTTILNKYKTKLKILKHSTINLMYTFSFFIKINVSHLKRFNTA